MIQTILPAAPGSPGPIQAGAELPAGGDGEVADFSALLEGLAAQLIPGTGPEVQPGEAMGQPVQPLPEGELAATTGKILPLDLPVAGQLIPEAAPEIAETAPAAKAPVVSELPVALLAKQESAEVTAKAEPEVQDAEEEDTPSAAASAPAPNGGTAATAATAAAPIAAPPVIAAMLPLSPAQAATPAPPDIGQPPSQGAANRAIAVPTDLAAPRAAARPERAMVGATAHARSKPSDVSATAKASLPSPAEAVRMDLPLQGSVATVQNAPVQPASPPPQVRPHEFSALIDRLAAARDGVATHTVSLTVAHQDFGPVRLHFRPDELGLSVSLTSADPDFARVAAAAPAPILPVQSSEQTSNASYQRSDSSAQGSTQGQGSAQSRGGSPERRDEPRHSQAQQRRTDPDNAGPRSGIFA